MMEKIITKKPDIDNGYPILDVISERWSPRAFSDRPIEKDKLMSLFEAARWAASSYNEQPWRFLVGMKGDKIYDQIFGLLNEWNQQWAKTAPVLMLSIAKKTYTKNGKPNAHAWHDVGLAMGNLLAQATSENIYMHQMGGFSREEANNLVDEDFEPVACAALGYLGDADLLPNELADKEYAEQTRKPLNEIVTFS